MPTCKPIDQAVTSGSLANLIVVVVSRALGRVRDRFCDLGGSRRADQ